MTNGVFYRWKMYFIAGKCIMQKTAQSIDTQRKSRNLNDYGICYLLERMTGIEPAKQRPKLLINQGF